MKKIGLFLIIIVVFISCNDGDFIVTNFDFEDAVLQDCGENGGYVFFKINTEVNESISLFLETNDSLFLETGVQTYELGEGTNTLNYRSFNDVIDNDYFCNPLPPTTPVTVIEYLGYSGTVNLQAVTLLDDKDGVDEVLDSTALLEEGLGDLDQDGLANYIDFDDDGDNVPTRLELGDNFPEAPLDTDMDGTPDYLDTDDDNDGVLTINEDANGDLNPVNDITGDDGPNYLNRNVSDTRLAEAYREHSYDSIINATIDIDNLILFNAEEELKFETFNLGFIEGYRIMPVLVTPNF